MSNECSTALFLKILSGLGAGQFEESARLLRRLELDETLGFASRLRLVEGYAEGVAALARGDGEAAAASFTVAAADAQTFYDDHATKEQWPGAFTSSGSADPNADGIADDPTRELFALAPEDKIDLEGASADDTPVVVTETDITGLPAKDSGINIACPSDVGINLQNPGPGIDLTAFGGVDPPELDLTGFRGFGADKVILPLDGDGSQAENPGSDDQGSTD